MDCRKENKLSTAGGGAPTMYTINMISSAYKVKGQGVASCYDEQVLLIKEGLADKFSVRENRNGERFRAADINHYHTIDPAFFIGNQWRPACTVSVCYVHFLPETVDESLALPRPARAGFYWYMRRFYRSMDYLVAVNPVFAKKLAELCCLDPARIRYIPNYVSDGLFRPAAAGEQALLKAALGLPPDRFTVLGVGQLQARKGVADFLAVARALPDVTFVWAGGFSFGQLSSGYDEIRRMAKKPPKNVKFLGIVPRERMSDVYNACDMLFLPSYSELFPMTILEAMCCKKPLLLRDLDLYPPILFDCYMKADGNAEFARAIRRLANDGEARREWGARSWEGHRHYTRESVLSRWEDFYTQILEARERPVKSRRAVSAGSQL
jgi:1,2-diacylglycerol-3-alpha-glucose alpha-1,2-galactosyltransferase